MKKYFTVLSIFILALISGCDRESVVDNNHITIPPTVKQGLYILCEGSGVNTSKLSYYDLDTTFYDNIYRPGNLGLYPDGMVLNGTNLLITEQGNYLSPGKIHRVDTSGMEISSQVVGMNPYSLCISNNKVYITNGPDTSVSVLDLGSFSFIKRIKVGYYPQEILSYNNRVFVCNTSYWGGPYDSTITVIDALADSVLSKIVLRREPTSIALSNDNKLLIGCGGVNGKIFKVDPMYFNIIDSYDVVRGFGKDISVDNLSERIYFISFLSTIVRLNLDTKVSETVIDNPSPSNNNYYGYVFDSKNRRHYVANARSFTSNGYIHKYDEQGNQLTIYQTGIIPRRMVLINN
jgi:YVTN family beta-propeller protein